MHVCGYFFLSVVSQLCFDRTYTIYIYIYTIYKHCSEKLENPRYILTLLFLQISVIIKIILDKCLYFTNGLVDFIIFIVFLFVL